ncbi:uncharacterized protein LOC127003657 [Eriocheir sinensis]|uniref:uncharacterized protein LOC127003657 n=1 Tax=Eriocheir sinensis TaxID=95602 RepID=UPI0021C6A944|nr:uncharacterized protein LOC127003657 [Eriocheir sinensis]
MEPFFDFVPVDVKEEPVDNQVSSFTTQQPPSLVDSVSDHSEDVLSQCDETAVKKEKEEEEEEDVCVKDEPIEDLDPATNCTFVPTLKPKLRNIRAKKFGTGGVLSPPLVLAVLVPPMAVQREPPPLGSMDPGLGLLDVSEVGPALKYDFADDGFKNIVVQNDANTVQLRTNAATEERAMQWLQVYMKRFRTALNRVLKRHVGKKLLFCCYYRCQHGIKKSQGKKKTYTGCSFRLAIKIKVITKYNMRHDKYVQEYPCIVIIHGEHNHSTDSASAYGQLKVLRETKEDFMMYFDAGMTIPQAKRFHEEKMLLNNSEMADSSTNPSSRAVSYLRQLWLAKNEGRLGGPPDMFSVIKRYADDHPASRIAWDTQASVVVLVTEFMLRVHKEITEAGDIVFVDTSSHVDQPGSALTALLCASPAGAVPLGLVFSSSHDEVAFTKGFGLLRDVLGEAAFHGKSHPDCFITDSCQEEKKALRAVWPHAKQYLCVFNLLRQLWRWFSTTRCVKKKDRPRMMRVAQGLVCARTDSEFMEVWEGYLSGAHAQKYQAYTRYLSKMVEQKQSWSLHERNGNLLHNANNFESTMCIIKDIVLNRCKGIPCYLLMYMNEVFDSYMQGRLLDVAQLGRTLDQALPRSPSDAFSIQRDGERYLVSSTAHDGVAYAVDPNIGFCECKQGRTGNVCRHQVVCAERGLKLSEAFVDSPECCRWLTTIAVGEKAAKRQKTH